MANVCMRLYIVTAQQEDHRAGVYASRRAAQKAVRAIRRYMVETHLCLHGLETMDTGYSYLRRTAKRVTNDIAVRELLVKFEQASFDDDDQEGDLAE